jgi:hypothetical protein
MLNHSCFHHSRFISMLSSLLLHFYASSLHFISMLHHSHFISMLHHSHFISMLLSLLLHFYAFITLASFPCFHHSCFISMLHHSHFIFMLYHSHFISMLHHSHLISMLSSLSLHFHAFITLPSFLCFYVVSPFLHFLFYLSPAYSISHANKT